jgi:hypothetical protein
MTRYNISDVIPRIQEACRSVSTEDCLGIDQTFRVVLGQMS